MFCELECWVTKKQYLS